MKNAMKTSILMILMLIVAIEAPAQNQAQPKVNYDAIAGTWALEINTGDAYFYLTLNLKVTEGKLEGDVSEQNGMFTNTPLSNIEFDGQTLRYEMKVPTPPEGAERLVKTEVKLVDGRLEGALTVEELGVSAAVTGTKK
jgi:hypothetical protein